MPPLDTCRPGRMPRFVPPPDTGLPKTAHMKFICCRRRFIWSNRNSATGFRRNLNLRPYVQLCSSLPIACATEAALVYKRILLQKTRNAPTLELMEAIKLTVEF